MIVERKYWIVMAIMALVVALAVAPQAYADDAPVDDVTATETEAEATDTSESTDATTETDLSESKQPSDDMQGGTDKCVDPSACEPENKQPECTENCEPPEVCEVDCEPVDTCVGAECDPPPVIPEPPTNVLPTTDAPTGGGNALPFTGIEDYFLPLAIGLFGLLAGYAAFRYAGLRDHLGRYTGELRAAAAAERRRSAYAEARERVERDAA